MDKMVKETLGKQLELLSERSKGCKVVSELISLTAAMVSVVDTLKYLHPLDHEITIDGEAISRLESF